ncbi:MAG: LWR-salt protein [Halobacteriaceae archaeon]
MTARYVFAVEFRLDPTRDVTVSPDTFETRLYRPADPPEEPGWLFFRDNLWRGEVGDPGHVRDLATETLGVDVVSVEYRAFETDRESYEALQDAIADNLALFEADDVPEVISKYLGSSVEIQDAA